MGPVAGAATPHVPDRDDFIGSWPWLTPRPHANGLQHARAERRASRLPHAGSCSDCGGPTPYCTACGIAYCAWCELGGCKTTQATLAPKCRAVAPLPPSPSLGEASLGEARSGAGQYADSGSDTDDSHREDAGDSEEGEDSHATADLLMCLSGSVERMQGDVSLDDRQRAVGVLQHVVSAVPGIFGSQQAYERWASRLTLAGNDDSDMAESDDSLPALRAATESDESDTELTSAACCRSHGCARCQEFPPWRSSFTRIMGGRS